jgi:hypothetical protein
MGVQRLLQGEKCARFYNPRFKNASEIAIGLAPDHGGHQGSEETSLMAQQAPQEKPKRSLRLAFLLAGARIASMVRGGSAKAEIYCKHKIAMDFVFRPRPDDIFIASYAKSGTTLLQMMLYQMTTDGEMDFPHIESVSPFFEDCYRLGFSGFVESLPSPRIFKTHLYHQHMPSGVRCIYIVRDFRDVVVSAFHHYRMMRGWSPEQEFRVFAESMLAGNTLFESWFEHTQSWWPHRHDPDVLFLRYEEVIQDIPGTARKIAAWSGLALTGEALGRIVERCSLAFMKQHNEKFDPRLRQLHPGRHEFIRKGVPGEGRTALTPGQEQKAAERLAELGRSLGLTPDDPYADLFFGGNRTTPVSASPPPMPPTPPSPQTPPAR